MSCHHPLKGFQVGFHSSGKPRLFVTSYDVDHVDITDRGFFPSDVPDFHVQGTNRFVSSFVELPCGHCVGCRLEYSRQWANRLMLELEYHDSAFFATLTYDDKHVPLIKDAYFDSDGYYHDSLSLCKRDVQLFMKRLRKRFKDDSIRFYLAGEYGDETFRPHYHAIIFGLHLDDLVPYGKSRLGFQYFTSDSFSRCWSVKVNSSSYDDDEEDIKYEPIGFCSLASVSWETCAYVARYVMKKQTGSGASVYDYFGIEPEFSLMSRRPGIARQWYDDHPDIYDYDYINISTSKGGKKFRPPKYYDRLYDITNHDEMESIKVVRREMAETSKRLKLSKTDLSYMALLAVEEASMLSRIKSLKRSL